MRASAELSPGTLVSDRYWVQRTLGYGSCGCTYLVQDKEDSARPYVLKEFAPTDTRESVIKKSYSLFEQEAQVLCKLKHAQIPQCFGSLEDNGRLFLVQEYIDGKTYCEILNERLERKEPFLEAEAIQWLKDLLPVLDYIHANRIVHRDISPDNIMLPKGGDKPVLIDFGVVKQVMTQIGSQITSPPGSSLGGTLVGKAGYSPPEQLRLGQCYPNSDLYALGVTVLVLLSGKHPSELCDGYSLTWQWRKYVKINAALGRIFDKMLAEIPKERFRTARQVMSALEEMSLDESAVNLHFDDDDDLWSEENTWIDYSASNRSFSKARANRSPQGTNFQVHGTVIQREPSGKSNPVIAKTSKPRSRRSIRRTQTLPMRLLALTCLISGSVVGGLAIGNLSPEIALVCELFNNCASDEQLSAIAQTESQSNKASTTSTSAPPKVDEWQQASDRANTPASPFVEVSEDNSTAPESGSTSSVDYQKELTEKVHSIQSQIAQLIEQRERQKAELKTNSAQNSQPTPQTEQKQPKQSKSAPATSISASSDEGKRPVERESLLPHRSNPVPPTKPIAIAKKTPETSQAAPSPTSSPAQKPASTTTNSSKKPTPTPEKKNPPAQTYKPGFWQPSARINPKRPFRVKLVNQSSGIIEYALTTNEFSPRQLDSEQNTLLTHVPLDANLLINAIESAKDGSAVSLRFDISVADNNVVNVTIRRNGREQPGASTVNVDRSGAIYVF